MKTTFLTLLIFISALLPGQAQKMIHSPGDKSIEVSPDYITTHGRSPIFGGGIKFRLFITERISFDGDWVIGDGYNHLELASIGIPMWCLLYNLDPIPENASYLFFKWVAIIISVEHITYHIPLNKNIDISPSIFIWKFKTLNQPDFNKGGQETFGIGIEINKYFKNFVLAPYAEYNVTYSDLRSGFTTGIYFGLYLPNRKSVPRVKVPFKQWF
jgi:hypothetical protein